MNTRKNVETLVRRGDIPDDAAVVSTNNKIVIISKREGLVARIGTAAHSQLRDDPHDLNYSHRVAWLAGDSAPVVKPLEEEPIVSGEFVISRYPLLSMVGAIDESRIGDVYNMTRGIGGALATVQAGMTLRRLNVATYVEQRLDHMQDDPEYNQELADYVRAETNRMNTEYPFEQLTQDDTAMVHGDFKADNFVVDDEGTLKAIDLDAVAAGPGLYDLASWRLRRELGDSTPVEDVVEIGRRDQTWNEDTFRALIGWKAISSMSFTLRYEDSDVSEAKVAQIAGSATTLGALSATPVHTTAR